MYHLLRANLSQEKPASQFAQFTLCLSIMGWRTRRDNRCAICQMRLDLCVCQELPVLTSKLKVSILVHPKEFVRTTNTGRLAHLCLKNSEYVQQNWWDVAEYVPEPLKRCETVWTFFPSLDATPLDHPELLEQVRGESITLLVPDGSWRQASKMVSRIAALKSTRKVCLPKSYFKSQYFLRRTDDESRFSTLEAIALALGFLGDQPSQNALIAAQELMVTRTLKARGSFGRIVNEMTAS